jgi:scyllo-inositol 2-dehydrogenase (NADP+)
MRVAIIGYGLAGSVFHAPLVASTEGLEVATIVTSNPRRQEEARRDHPDARVVERAEDAFDADLVVVATPNDTHAPLARAALERGAAVVVDKPLALTAAEAAELVALGGRLTVFQNRRWDSDQLTLHRLVRDGELGEVFRCESRFERWRPEPKAEPAWRETRTPEQGGGVLLDLGSHLVDEALRLLGPARSVYAEIDARRGGAADDDAFVAIRHESGGYSHLRTSAVTAAPGPRLRVLGSEAAFVVEGLDGQEAALRDGLRPGRDEPWGEGPPGRLVRGDDEAPVEAERGDWPAFYRGVERWLRGPGEAPPVDPRDAVHVLEVIEAARSSATEGSIRQLRELLP